MVKLRDKLKLCDSEIQSYISDLESENSKLHKRIAKLEVENMSANNRIKALEEIKIPEPLNLSDTEIARRIAFLLNKGGFYHNGNPLSNE